MELTVCLSHTPPGLIASRTGRHNAELVLYSNDARANGDVFLHTKTLKPLHRHRTTPPHPSQLASPIQHCGGARRKPNGVGMPPNNIRWLLAHACTLSVLLMSG